MTPSEAANAVRHDLGKYVALQQRWLPPDADPDAVRAAVLSDVLATRRGPAGTEDALAVWEKLRPQRKILGTILAPIEALMDELAPLVPRLRATPTDAEVAAAGRLARAVADACRNLPR